MDRDGIKQFLRTLDVKQNQIKDENEWVMCPCLLARYTHDSGKDSRASFGVSVHSDDTSIYHCFTCHESGTLVYLLQELERYTGEDHSDLKDQFEVGEEFGPPLTSWSGERGEPQERLGDPLHKDYMRLYEWPGKYPEARAYLRERFIEPETCKRLQLQYDPDDERILFPVFDHHGAHYGFSGRAIGRGVDPRIKDYFGLPKRLLLLGAERVLDADRILICEGLFDYAWLQQLGFPAVALLGTELTPGKVEILKELRKPVYAFTDNDRPGFDAARQIAKELIAHVPVFEVEYPTERADLSINDPAELSKADVLMMMGDAELFDV